MKKEKVEKGLLKWIVLVLLLVIAISGIYFWYTKIKKPHEEAVEKFITVSENVKAENSNLDTVIDSAQAVLDSGEPVYDETTIDDLTLAISNAQSNKIEIPKLPEETEEILSVVEALSQPLDYSSSISTLEEKKINLENSIKQMKQITNPSSDFIIQRLQGIDGISTCQAVTESHDPNGMLNKQGGYTACVYFSSPWVNQDTIYGSDIIEKGTDCGGCIEVFATKEDATTRNDYLSAFDGSGMLNPGSHNVIGTIVVRTSNYLTASQQTDLTNCITEKLIELQ